MNDYLSRLRSCLEREFYANNFAEIASIALKAAGNVDRPLFFYVVWGIFQRLADYWTGRRLDDEAGKHLEALLKPPIISYLDGVESGLSPELEVEYLNAIARAHLVWLDERSPK